MRRSDVPKSRHHIWIEDEIWEKLGEHYGETLGISGAINNILRVTLKAIESRAELKGKAPAPASIEDIT